jgi:hypothetical protein
VIVEYGNRHTGDRFLHTPSPAHQKLALAECAAFHATNSQFHESMTLRDLYYGELDSMENWNEVSRYNSFLQNNATFYEGPKSVARIAVVIDAKAKDIAALRRNS